eukprot:GHVU01098753.1.p1 GENE.GHVU01098753.1~~GHVU01098753.1.p1  ORF type:complete len:106 (+),score=10.24 GHVU01098753.1:132-449(+)
MLLRRLSIHTCINSTSLPPPLRAKTGRGACACSKESGETVAIDAWDATGGGDVLKRIQHRPGYFAMMFFMLFMPDGGRGPVAHFRTSAGRNQLVDEFARARLSLW